MYETVVDDVTFEPLDGVTVSVNVVDEPLVLAVAVAEREAVWLPPVVPDVLIVEPGTMDIVYALVCVSAPGVHDAPAEHAVIVEVDGPAMLIAVISYV